MSPIEKLFIVAGPTGCGKSTLIRAILAGLPEFNEKTGITNMRQWNVFRPRALLQHSELAFEGVILHYDFLWSYPGANLAPERQPALRPILEAARAVYIVSLWTPPRRLKRQVIDGKLRARLQNNAVQSLKAMLFKALPRHVIIGISTLPFFAPLTRPLELRPFRQYLLVLRPYSRRERVAALYRRWFQFCDAEGKKIRGHWIVEFDGEVRFYSRAQWEEHVASGGASRERNCPTTSAPS